MVGKYANPIKIKRDGTMSWEGVKPSRRIRLEVDAARLQHNFAAVRQRVGDCSILTVLKSDAYGVGAKFMAALAVRSGAGRIGVADLEEALELEQYGLPVQVLGVLMPDEVPVAVAHDLVCPVNGLALARTLSCEALRQGKTVRVHVIIDTGMGRFGLRPSGGAAAAEIRAIKALPGLNVEGVYSHFPMAGIPGEPATLRQIAEFRDLLAVLEQEGIAFAYRHFAASDGITCQEESLKKPFNMVRLGLLWYGHCRNDYGAALHLRPALRLKTVVGAVRELPAESTVGYFRTCKLTRKTKVATICAGYADGLPLALSNRGRVLIHGVSCPILGRLSMDYTTVDVSAVPDEVGWGTPVTLWGDDGAECVEIEEWARLKNTHAHDILCALGTRVERVYTTAD